MGTGEARTCRAVQAQALSYRISIEKRAQKALRRLPSGILRRLHEAIDELSAEPRPPGCEKLSGRPGWRIRVGDYRVIYEIRDDALLVLVIEIGHRREVYR
ncbi:MAG: type II toxin-antitoxin system RelE family toxin [Tagaea sp.]